MAGNRVISAVLTLKDKNFGTTAQKSASAMKDLERKTQHSSNTIKKFGTSAVNSFKRVAVGAASIVTALGVMGALSKGFNMIRDSIGSAFSRIDVMEKFERTMTVLTGSTEKTKAALEATRDAVTGTAYGLDVAAQSVQNFVTRGMEVEKATKTIAIWGDAVAFYGDGSNEQLETVSDALGKMYSSGKVQMDQMNRLFDAGIDAVGMYAKATNRDVASVQKDLSKGKISAEDFIDVVGKAMTEGTNGVQKIAGAAKEAGASWSGTFANMKAAVTRGVESIIMKIDEMLEAKGLPAMREMVARFGSKFESVLKSAGDKVPALADAIMNMYYGIKPALDWLKDTAFPAIRTELAGAFEAAQPAIAWVKDVGLPGIGNAVVIAVEGFTSLYNFVKDNLPILTPVVGGVAATVVAFKVGVAAVTAATRLWALATSAVQIATLLLNGTLVVSPLGWVALAIGAVVAAGIALYQNWDTVKAKTSELWEKLKDNPLLALAVGPMGALIAAGITLWKHFDKIKAAFEGFKRVIKNFVLPKWVSTIGGVIGGAVTKLKGIAGGRAPMDSFAVGTNRVKEDMVAQIHKDEMIVPARQSRNLRKQGVTIDNVDKGGPTRARVASQSTGGTRNHSINIAKLADQIIVREEADIDKIATLFVKKLESVNFNMA